MLAKSDNEEVVRDTRTEQKGRDERGKRSREGGGDFYEGVGRDTLEVACRGVVEKVQHTTTMSATTSAHQRLMTESRPGVKAENDLHAGKGDVDDVGQLGLVRRRLRVTQEEDVVQLSEGVDGNGNVGTLQIVRVLLVSLEKKHGIALIPFQLALSAE